MRTWNIKSARIWTFYAVLLGGLVYSAIAGMESTYASGPCTAQECSAVQNSIAPSVCAHQNSQVWFVNCSVGSTTWDAECTNGYQFNGVCPG